MAIKVNQSLTQPILDVLDDMSIKVVCSYETSYDSLSFINEYLETCAEYIILDMFGKSAILG